MSAVQLWDGLIGAAIGALVGLVPAVLALRASKKANELTEAANETARREAAAAEEANRLTDVANETARQATAAAQEANGTSAAALEETRLANVAAAKANAIAESAVEEARLARKIQYDDWHRQATPRVTLEVGREQHELGGHPLRFSCDRDIDSGKIALAAGYDDKAISGLGASPDEQVFNFGTVVALPAVEAGETAVKGIWTGDPERAAGLTVQLRCTVTIGPDSWTVPVLVTLPRLPAKPVGLPRPADDPDISTAGF